MDKEKIKALIMRIILIIFWQIEKKIYHTNMIIFLTQLYVQ